MSPVRALPKCVAICAFDPGRVTGVARGVFPVADADSIMDAWSRGWFVESWETEGTPAEQAMELADEFMDWLSERLIFGLIPIPDLHVVYEDFQLRQRSADLAPVEVTHSFLTLWERKALPQPIRPTTQMPSEAMTYATNDRLKRWGAWVRGSEHRRDANRHVLLKLSKLLG